MTQTPAGNAYRVILPPGTVITLPDDASAAQVRAVSVSEAATTGTRAVTLTASLQLVSPEYIAGRNASEERYARRIAELEEKLRAATTAK